MTWLLLAVAWMQATLQPPANVLAVYLPASAQEAAQLCESGAMQAVSVLVYKQADGRFTFTITLGELAADGTLAPAQQPCYVLRLHDPSL